MNRHAFAVFLSISICVLGTSRGFSQTPTNSQPDVIKNKPDAGAEIDSLRKKEEQGQDTVILTAKYIRYTTLRLLQDSTQTFPIDTSLNNLENYNALYQPQRPTISLGNLGLAYREMLFSPRKNIGFDAGFHSLDLYFYTQDSVKYYRAQSPYTQLNYTNGGQHEQLFRATHSQNIKPNLNFAAVYNRIGAPGFYQNQKADHTNIALSSWYQSPEKRYTLLANTIINMLKAGENGSVLNDTIFTSVSKLPGRNAETVRLSNNASQSGFAANRSRQTWKSVNFMLKQFYYIGKVDSLTSGSGGTILPTQRVSHTISYNTNRYKYFKNEADTYNAFPKGSISLLTEDSTQVKNLRNELMYSFYLRGRQVKFLKNEVKLDVGIEHNWYEYRQMAYKNTFQNITLKAIAGYRFSDRINLNANLQQISQGAYAGDFLYEATSNILLSNLVGRIVLGAYLLNKSPEEIFDRANYQYHKWNLDFGRSKISNLSFAYVNPKFNFFAKAEYTLSTNYLYFKETATAKQVIPTVEPNLNVLKITAEKSFSYKKFTLRNFAAYQKTDASAILGLPKLYIYNSLYFSNRFFKSVDAQIGLDSRFNSSYKAPSYAINISQFYVSQKAVEFSSYPVMDVWIKASLRRANIFFKYNYINQGLFSKGYYTVNRYPMPDKAFKFGVSWNFYN